MVGNGGERRGTEGNEGERRGTEGNGGGLKGTGGERRGTEGNGGERRGTEGNGGDRMGTGGNGWERKDDFILKSKNRANHKPQLGSIVVTDPPCTVIISKQYKNKRQSYHLLLQPACY